MSNISQTLDFFARWEKSFDELCDSFRGNFADDCVWDQRPIPRLKGPDQAVRFLKLSRASLRLATIAVEVERIAEDGDVVLCSRVDRLRRADESLIVAAPVAGVLEFENGKIVRWREYFDAGGLVAQALGTSFVHLGRRARAFTARNRRAS
jgi:limonene-1,2-epoxide hydrolase